MKRLALLCSVLVALLGAGCEGDGNTGGATATSTATVSPPTPTATTQAGSVTATMPSGPAATTTATTTAAGPTATTTAACPVTASACAGATQIAGWLRAGDVASISQATQTRSYTCPGGQPSGAGGPFPLCEGAAAGTMRSGMGVARRYSEGAILSTDAYQASIRGVLQAVDASASDANGSGALRLVGVSCVDPAQPPLTCTRSIAIFSAIVRQTSVPGWGIGGGRELLLFYLDTSPSASGVRIQEMWTGIIMPNEAPIIFQNGGTLFDLGRVFVLR